ncbi:hypothetical protein H4217_006154 [Coemansia sp. RSA 1939]|nr:hypothetical protein H4217_006154 [Coemansia sp. RSA 1939]KAJ2609087.1 hypothetical protein EV177_004643 [Coemansia sp. RSA 1804]
MQNIHSSEGQLNGMQGQAGADVPLSQQLAHDSSGLGKFGMTGTTDYNQHQQFADAMAAAAAAAQQQQDQSSAQPRSPAPMYPGPTTIPTNFSSGQINSPESLQQFQTNFWKAHLASIEDNVPDFKTHLLPLARIKKVMKSDPDVKVQMISAEAPILFSKACEIFITEITQRAWLNAEENKRRTLQRQDVSFAAQRSEMFDFLIDVVPREEFPLKKVIDNASEEAAAIAAATQATAAAAAQKQRPQQPQQPQQPAQQPSLQQQQQQQQAPQQQQPHTPSLYNDPAFHQYYAQHLAEAAGFSQAAGATPEQRQAYYQQIEREQLQWLQRQANMGVGQQQPPPPQGLGVPFGDGGHQQQQQHPDSAAMGDGDHGN